jgi:hypothetical protein
MNQSLNGAISYNAAAEHNDASGDFEFPQREAAFFYGLFLRGHSVDELRNDISVPPQVLAKWSREVERRPDQRAEFDRILEYRRHVLAIFNSLVSVDPQKQRLQ